MTEISTTFHLYEAEISHEKAERTVYVAATSLAIAAKLVEESLFANYVLTSIKISNDEHIIVPDKRSDSYKLFYAEIRGEYAGRKTYIVAENAIDAVRLLEEWINGSGYIISKFFDTDAWSVLVEE